MNNVFEVAGQRYRIGMMDAMKQFHCVRRLGPALVICGVTFKMLQEGVAVSLDDWATVAGPVMSVVSQMSDEDVEYVVYTCLRCVTREQADVGAGGWAPLAHPKENILMFQDVDMAAMLRITVEVLRDKLTNFATGLTGAGTTSNGSGAASL